jgi:hypothetical protein
MTVVPFQLGHASDRNVRWRRHRTSCLVPRSVLCSLRREIPQIRRMMVLGNAKSNGNPFGAAAAVGVFLVPTMFLRLFAPPQYLTGVLMGCVRLLAT